MRLRFPPVGGIIVGFLLGAVLNYFHLSTAWGVLLMIVVAGVYVGIQWVRK